MPKFSNTYQPNRRGDQNDAGEANRRNHIIRQVLIIALQRPVKGRFDEMGKPLICKDVIAEKLVELAEQGDMAAIRLIFDRMEGRPAQCRQEDNGNTGYAILALAL